MRMGEPSAHIRGSASTLLIRRAPAPSLPVRGLSPISPVRVGPDHKADFATRQPAGNEERMGDRAEDFVPAIPFQDIIELIPWDSDIGAVGKLTQDGITDAPGYCLRPLRKAWQHVIDVDLISLPLCSCDQPAIPEVYRTCGDPQSSRLWLVGAGLRRRRPAGGGLG